MKRADCAALAVPCVATLSTMLAMCGPALAEPPKYSVNVIPTLLPGLAGAASDINDRGQVVGYVRDSFGNDRPWLYDSDGLHELQLPFEAQGRCIARAITERGMIVGSGGDWNSLVTIIWDPGSSTGRLMTGQSEWGSDVMDVNEDGVIVGMQQNSSRWVIPHANSTAYVGREGETKPLLFAHPQVTAFAESINNAGQVLIGGIDDVGSRAVYMYDPQCGVHQLETLGAFGGYAWKINASGQICGSVNSGGVSSGVFAGVYFTVPCVWYQGALKLLPLPAGHRVGDALSINDAGVAVGYATVDYGLNSKAMVWMDGTGFDLNALLEPGTDWTVTNALVINNRGQIVCLAKSGAVSQLVILTPK